MDREHQEIFDLVIARDLRGAKKVLSEHILNVKKQVLGSLRQILKEQEALGF